MPADVETAWRLDRVFEPRMDEALRDALYAGWTAAVRHAREAGADHAALDAALHTHGHNPERTAS